MIAFLHAHPYVLVAVIAVAAATLYLVAWLLVVRPWLDGIRYSRTDCKHLRTVRLRPLTAEEEAADDGWADTLHGINADKDPVLCGDVRSAWVRDPARAETAGRPPWETAPQRAVQTVNLPELVEGSGFNPSREHGVRARPPLDRPLITAAGAPSVQAYAQNFPGQAGRSGDTGRLAGDTSLPGPVSHAARALRETRAGEPTVVNVTVNIAVIHQPGTDLAAWMLDYRAQFDAERAALATWARELTGSPA